MLAVVPTSGELPLLGRVKRALDPLLSWTPDWLEAFVWAVVVYALGLSLLVLAAWYGIPWLGRALQRPAAALLNGLGVVLILPEYLLTARKRRRGRSVSHAAIRYGDLVQGVTMAAQGGTRRALSALGVFKHVPPVVPALAMLVGLIGWNGSYCEGRGEDCRMPTTVWASSVWDWATPDLGGSQESGP